MRSTRHRLEQLPYWAPPRPGRLDSPDQMDLVPKVRVYTGWIAQAIVRLAGAEALVLGRRIFLSASTWRRAERGSRRALALLEHELVHVEQYRRLGLWRFLYIYLSEYLAGRRRGLSHYQAYLGISLEQEARRLAAERTSP